MAPFHDRMPAVVEWSRQVAELQTVVTDDGAVGGDAAAGGSAAATAAAAAAVTATAVSAAAALLLLVCQLFATALVLCMLLEVRPPGLYTWLLPPGAVCWAVGVLSPVHLSGILSPRVTKRSDGRKVNTAFVIMDSGEK